jgi:hypothetical protein
MIYIEKNTENTFVLELKWLGTMVATPYYLFEFINEFDIERVSRFFTTPDVSNSTNRYNKFILEESDSGSDGNVDSLPINLVSGQYKYNVYRSDSPIDIDDDIQISDIVSNNPISTARMVVEGDNQIIDSVYL